MREDGDGDDRGEALEVPGVPGAPTVQYFALLRDGGTAQDASGLIRRTHNRPIPTDEAIGNDFGWHPTEYLRLYRLGHNDTDHVEITAEDAQALLARWRVTWAARSPDPPQTSGP